MGLQIKWDVMSVATDSIEPWGYSAFPASVQSSWMRNSTLRVLLPTRKVSRMYDDVKKCVDARLDYLNLCLVSPPEIKPEIDAFSKDVTKLGEACPDAEEFERRFAAEGLFERFSSLVCKCTQNGTGMNVSDIKRSAKITGGILGNNRKQIVKDIVDDACMYARVEAIDRATTESREQMIEDGTLADYTIKRNMIEDGLGIIGSLARRFKKH